MIHFPNQPVTLNGVTYTLAGNFRTLAAIEQALGRDIIAVQSGMLELKLHEFAKVLAAATGAGEAFLGQALFELGMVSAEYKLLVYTVMGWLLVALSPPQLREEKARDMGELIARASPGANTAASASAS